MFDTSHLHPMLVHFPIALVVVGFVAELAGLLIKKELQFTKVGFYLLLVGTLAAILAWVSGMVFTAEMSGEAGELREFHEHMALATMLILIVASVIRWSVEIRKITNQNWKWIAFVLYGIAAITVSITGFLGGTLVYNFMMPL